MGCPKKNGAGAPGGADSGGVYEIRIKGTLDERWLDWFEGMTLRHMPDEESGQEVTIINATLSDQPALHGFLNKIRDLNLTLISVKRLRPSNGGSADDHRCPL